MPRSILSGLALGFALAFATGSSALAQQNVNIRGTLSGFDGSVLSIKTRDGRDVQIGRAHV